VDLVEQAVGPGVLDRWDAEAASQLVLLLAALADLKSRRMLGEAVDEEPDPDALEQRERLAARLIAYAPYARAAEWLAAREAASAGPRLRRVPLETPAPVAEPGRPADLAAAMARLLAAPPAPSLVHMGRPRRPLPEVLQRLRDSLVRLRTLSFDRMVEGADRLEEALTLLAALELARRGDAVLDQPEPFGDITIRAAARG
jgi:segregation and condensation protein A